MLNSYSGDDFATCREFVLGKLGMPLDAWRREPCRQFGGTANGAMGNRREKLRQIGEASSERFTANTAERTGRSERAVQRDAASATAKSAAKDATANLAVASDDTARIARARAIWDGAGPAQGSLVETYLSSRGLSLDLVYNVHEVIRFHPRCPWRDEAENRTIYVPAMIAAMRAIDGDTITAVHRTRLTPSGEKVDRRMLGIAAGAAIKLDADDAVTGGLAVGEGIESCLAARQLGFRPVWALASAGAVAAFPVLGGIEALTLLAENDPASDRAISQCAERWHAAGRAGHGCDAQLRVRPQRRHSRGGLMDTDAKLYTATRWEPPPGRFVDDMVTLTQAVSRVPLKRLDAFLAEYEPLEYAVEPIVPNRLALHAHGPHGRRQDGVADLPRPGAGDRPPRHPRPRRRARDASRC